MQNITLLNCREANGFSIHTVAARLGVTPTRYKELESGRTCLTLKQAGKLEKLYKIKAHYFYVAALQVELLRSSQEMLFMQKQRIDRLSKELNRLRKRGSRIRKVY